MKFLIVLAVIFAVAAIGFLIATMFVGGNSVSVHRSWIVARCIYPRVGGLCYPFGEITGF